MQQIINHGFLPYQQFLPSVGDMISQGLYLGTSWWSYKLITGMFSWRVLRKLDANS